MVARPDLREVPLHDVFPPQAKQVVLTISVGQTMTTIHRVGYDMGFYLLELDDNEVPVRAYHRGGAALDDDWDPGAVGEP